MDVSYLWSWFNYPELEIHLKCIIMIQKFECQFTAVSINKNNSVMFNNFENTTLGMGWTW